MTTPLQDDAHERRHTASSESYSDASSQQQRMDFLYQFFSSRVHITASGSSGPTPRRSQPLDCWLPVHTRYNWANRSVDQKPIDAAMARAVPGSFPRTVDSLKAKGGKAVVYDRDIITTWRLPDTISGHEVFFLEKAFEDAISHETLFVALGAFAEQGGPSLLDSEPDDLLRQLHGFLSDIGTQPVTITISSIVQDMKDSYLNQSNVESQKFRCNTEQSLESALEEFVLMQHCWYFTPGRVPIVEVSFSASPMNHRRPLRNENIMLHLHFSWNPPTISFNDLQNVVAETDEYVLKPAISAHRPFSAMTGVAIEYFAEFQGDWLHWIDTEHCFRGRVPPRLASVSGTQRQDVYTMPVQLRARVIKHFPGGIRHETYMRCAMPLTVRRRPDGCTTFAEDHPLPSPLRILLSRKSRRYDLPSPRQRDVEVRMVNKIELDRPRERTPFSPTQTWQPKTPGGHDSDEDLERPGTVMHTPHLELHVNCRGELDDASDKGTPLKSPIAEDVTLSQNSRPTRVVHEHRAYMKSPTRQPKPLPAGSTWKKLHTRASPFDSTAVVDGGSDEEWVDRDDTSVGKGKQRVDSVFLPIKATLPETIAAGLMNEAESSPASMLAASMVDVTKRGKTVHRGELRTTLGKLCAEGSVASAQPNCDAARDFLSDAVRRKLPVHCHDRFAQAAATVDPTAKGSAPMPGIPAKSDKRSHLVCSFDEISQDTWTPYPHRRSHVSSVGRTCKSRHDSFTSTENDTATTKPERVRVVAEEQLSRENELERWQAQIQKNFEELKVNSRARAEKKESAKDDEDMSMWDSDSSPVDLDEVRAFNWNSRVG